ncbi:DUF2063 domain-containing protein [Leptospira wolffii]|uniref:HvfC/BufC N-terminal domain-containing protein n=1 Tax=Leptospira wolffii TaxID=409998 RepID=UPI001082D649|nr:DNA-binding domain-containing protein [Leptospira wolffii]TGL49089.1 DUF2063 domain-containing protein [Leptospira wolffii]
MNPSEFRKEFSESIRGDSFSPILESLILPGGSLNTLQALKVYKEGYLARLTQALGEKFETVWRILGDDGFFEVCSEYILRFPSRTYNLSDYGERFPFFLKERFEEHAFISETADLELRLSEIFHLSKNERFELQNAFHEANPEDLRLEFHESLQFLKYAHKILPLWKNRKSGENGGLPVYETQFVLIGKEGNDLLVREIGEWDWKFGKELSKGSSVLEAVESSGNPPNGIQSVSEFLSGLTRASLIRGIKIS